MDPETTKSTIDATEKLAESLAPTVIKKVLGWMGTKPTRPIKPRGEWERRSGVDRRVSGLDQRLRRGIWLEFHRRSDLGKFEPLQISLQSRAQLRDAVIAEGARYYFYDRSSAGELGAAMVASVAVEVVANSYSGAEESAVLVVEAIAEYILLKFNVAARDQRKTLRRKQAAS